MYMKMYTPLVTEIVSMADFRSNLRRLLDAVQGTHERVIVTRRGREAAVVMSLAELESLEETLEVMRDVELVAAIREGEAAAAAGDTHTLDEVKRELGL